MQVAYIQNSKSESGVGRRAQALAERLLMNPPSPSSRGGGVHLQEWMIDGRAGKLVRDGSVQSRVRPWPGVFSSKSLQWVRLGRKIRPTADLYDLTNQTLSFLTSRLQPAAVTVHDLIELLEPQTHSAHLLNRYLYGGIPQAAHIIAVSHYTARQVQEFYTVAAENVSVIYNGVDGAFHPIAAFRESVAYHRLRQRLRLPDNARAVLYVGSDHPRKNLPGALQAFAQVREKYPELVFIKVGEAGLRAGRAATLAAIDTLGVREAVRFIGSVALAELNELYNLADVLMLPSRFEGFGLPPLEAFAAGTPVIASNATSLPEVTGDDGEFGKCAALVRDPDDVDGMAADIMRILEDLELAGQLRAMGLARVKRFSWDAAAEQVLEVYARVKG